MQKLSDDDHHRWSLEPCAKYIKLIQAFQTNTLRSLTYACKYKFAVKSEVSYQAHV